MIPTRCASNAAARGNRLLTLGPLVAAGAACRRCIHRAALESWHRIRSTLKPGTQRHDVRRTCFNDIAMLPAAIIHGEMRVCPGHWLAERHNDLELLARKGQRDLVWDLFASKVVWRGIDGLRKSTINVNCGTR